MNVISTTCRIAEIVIGCELRDQNVAESVLAKDKDRARGQFIADDVQYSAFSKAVGSTSTRSC